MLDVNTLPKRYRKVEEFENFNECYSQMRFRSKRTEEEKNISKQMLVPKKSV